MHKESRRLQLVHMRESEVRRIHPRATNTDQLAFHLPVKSELFWAELLSKQVDSFANFFNKAERVISV